MPYIYNYDEDFYVVPGSNYMTVDDYYTHDMMDISTDGAAYIGVQHGGPVEKDEQDTCGICPMKKTKGSCRSNGKGLLRENYSKYQTSTLKLYSNKGSFRNCMKSISKCSEGATPKSVPSGQYTSISKNINNKPGFLQTLNITSNSADCYRQNATAKFIDYSKLNPDFSSPQSLPPQSLGWQNTGPYYKGNTLPAKCAQQNLSYSNAGTACLSFYPFTTTSPTSTCPPNSKQTNQNVNEIPIGITEIQRTHYGGCNQSPNMFFKVIGYPIPGARATGKAKWTGWQQVKDPDKMTFPSKQNYIITGISFVHQFNYNDCDLLFYALQYVPIIEICTSTS